jgi:hypothetical protein
MGIASVVVMPVINDDGVLGVFELFSGRVNAFGERDLSAVQRLSEMVETAIRLAQATVSLPGALKPAVPEVASLPALESATEDGSEEILDEEIFGSPRTGQQLPVASKDEIGVPGAQTMEARGTSEASTVPNEAAPAQQAAGPAAQPAAPPKKLFWSLSVNPAAEAEKPALPDQSHVPPVLRGLRKCEVCGFPVTAGRVLCVECEEKKWRGQLRRPPTPLR